MRPSNIHKNGTTCANFQLKSESLSIDERMLKLVIPLFKFDLHCQDPVVKMSTRFAQVKNVG